ncbi:MAG: SDR family oxidoreductase [Myxococcota bacterium]
MLDLRGSKFLVTGGAGFIGSSLVEAILGAGAAKVRVLDDFSTGRRSNIQPFLNDIELLEADLRDAAAVERAVSGMDYVLHQGAIPSVPRSIDEPAITTAVNVGGTIHVLSAAARAGVKRVVFASSSSVYGNSEVLPKHEDMPLSTLSPYAASKGAGELFARSMLECFGLETVCLRYFNIFGPKQDPNSQYAAVIPRFIRAIQVGEPVPVYGDGLQTRDFTFVGNVIEANLKACFAPHAAGERINIGCGEKVTLLDLAYAMGRIMGKEVVLQHLPARTGDVRHSLADITRARQLLGYEGRISLEAGLARTVPHFLAHE